MELLGTSVLACWFALGVGVHIPPTVFFHPYHAVICGGAGSDGLLFGEVHIDSVSDMKGYDTGIASKPEHLSFLEARQGDTFTSAEHPSAFFWTLEAGTTEDMVFVNGAGLGGHVSAPGHLFSLCFVPPWNDETVGSPLAFVSSVVMDSANVDVPVETRDGTISVYCPTSVDHIRWNTIKSLYH